MSNPDKAVIIVCSSPYSKRIPRKCFKYVNGKMVLEHIFDRIESLNIPIILAVPFKMDSENLKEYKSFNTCYKKVAMFGGDNDSPLHRMALAIDTLYPENPPKYVVRITHDDMIIDADTINLLLDVVEQQNASYGCTPDIIEGAGVEVILTETILEQSERIDYPVEHLSYFVKGDNPIKVRPRQSICRPYRLTLDYEQDYIVLETVLRSVGNNATVDDICKFIDENQLLMKYNELPYITIYTCVHNAEKYISDCISSVFLSAKMSKLKFEYLIIDDYSTDRSMIKALQQLGMWETYNYRVFTNSVKQGLASSSNIALANARGKYIMRIDADDMLIPTAINDLLKKISEDDSVIIYPAYTEINDLEPANNTVIPAHIHHHAGCAIMNKKTINELKFKEGLMHWDSLELYNRIKTHPELKISYYDKPVFLYRKHENSLSAGNDKERADTLEKIINKYGIKGKENA